MRLVSAQMDRDGRVVWALFAQGAFVFEMSVVNGRAYTTVYVRRGR